MSTFNSGDEQDTKSKFEKNKPTLITIGVIVLLLLAGFVIYRTIKNSKDDEYVNTQSPTVTTQTPASEATTTPDVVKTPVPSGSSAYQKALITYKNRFQFNQCHGTDSLVGRGSLVIKQGVKFMIDNRDPIGHTFAFKGFSARVGAYGYVIATPTILGIYPITCDGGGAAQLNVQK